ncbi:hypothetical protein V5O48_014000 [Marasmius crinis-equi]|uniref:Uncharacterized protein n=1 Tax=Marasmius crinis-equi TaxID=585013 RepID=A0ABR3EYL6_9AGAR
MEDLDMLAPEYNDQARSRFIRYRLLGGTPLGALFDDNPLVKAFVEGFSIPLNDGGRVTMSTVFGGAVKTLLPNLTPNVLTKGEDIVNDLIWQSSRHGDSTFGSLILTDNEQKFKSAFLHWIQGAGHVDHRKIRERISSEEFERVKDCRHLRVRAFSCHVSGSEIRAENYMMNFTTPRTQDNFPISVHTCDRRVDISLTYDLIFMLNTIASDSSSSEAGRRHFLTIKHAYEQLGAQVNRAIRSQVGDSAHVEAEYQAAQQFLQAVEEHRQIVPGPDYNVIVTSVCAMMEALAEAIEHSEDRHVPVVQVTHQVYTGRPGRPRTEIDPQVLETALEMRGFRGLEPVFGVNARTIRRRAVEYGIRPPGNPVYVEYVDEESGQQVRIYNSH